MTSFAGAMEACPLIAILRGVQPVECVDIGTALVDAGFTMIEVPLNSPDPLESIELLAKAFGDRVLIGGGTVLTPLAAGQVSKAGGRLVVSPNADASVVREAKRLNLTAMPGFVTPTDAFWVLEAGADALKLFPAEGNAPSVLKSLRAVLPKELPILPVGSITTKNMKAYWTAGANGFGIGSAIYRPGATAKDVSRAAKAFRKAFEPLRSGSRTRPKPR